MDHQLRRAELAGRLPALELDALLITALSNVRYLTGFTGSNAQLLVTGDASVLVTDGRYVEQASHETDELSIRMARELGAPLAELATELDLTRIGFEDDDVTVAAHGRWSEALGGVELVGTRGEVARQRWIKDPEELEHLRSAQRVTDQAFEDVLDWIALGQTERQVAHQLERMIHRDGADGLSFESIVAFGEQAAEPHHHPGHRVLAEGDAIKLDFGALWQGYHADMTRTVAFGEPPPILKKVHDVVQAAQQAGIDAVRAGVLASDVDAAARGVIEDAGYGERFAHGLGHGVGLDIHEGPGLSRDSGDVLPAGAVVTIEPGIYLPGIGGVRIEDMVEVTDDGCRVLGASSRDLIEL